MSPLPPDRIDIATVPSDDSLPAGDFATWLAHTRAGRRRAITADVPCGSCTSCCKSSYFIHIAANERKTRARIPKALLFHAPGFAKGNVLMGYNAHGHCPMLVDDACSIYEDRPQTCREYDCRVFAASGISAGGAEKAGINDRVARWRFSFQTERDQQTLRALRRAAEFLESKNASFLAGSIPSDPTQRALLALEVHELFFEGEQTDVRSDADTVRLVLSRAGATPEARPATNPKRS